MGRKIKIEAVIKYRIKSNHPDKDCVVGGWDPEEIYEYTDTYIFNEDYYPDEETRVAFMKHDLMTIAGGGYRTDTIELCDLEFCCLN